MTSPNSCHDENQKREEEVGRGGDALLSLCDEKEVTEASPSVFFFFLLRHAPLWSCCCCFLLTLPDALYGRGFARMLLSLVSRGCVELSRRRSGCCNCIFTYEVRTVRQCPLTGLRRRVCSVSEGLFVRFLWFHPYRDHWVVNFILKYLQIVNHFGDLVKNCVCYQKLFLICLYMYALKWKSLKMLIYDIWSLILIKCAAHSSMDS